MVIEEYFGYIIWTRVIRVIFLRILLRDRMTRQQTKVKVMQKWKSKKGMKRGVMDSPVCVDYYNNIGKSEDGWFQG